MKDANEGFPSRTVTTAMITNTEVLRQTREQFERKYMGADNLAKTIGSMIIAHYDQYKVAPNGNMEDIWKKYKDRKSVNPDEAKDMEDLLYGLSEDDKKSEFAPEDTKYQVDAVLNYWGGEQLKLHLAEVTALIDEGKIGEALKLTSEFNPISITGRDTINDFIWSLKDMRSHKRVKPLLLMGPWLRAGQTTIIYGKYGTGKSLLALVIAYVLGSQKFKEPESEIGEWQVKNQTGCLYIDGELGECELEERIAKFEHLGEQRVGMEIKVFPVPEYQLETEDTFYLSDRKNQQRIIQWLKDHPAYGLIVLDSVGTLFGIDEENSNSEWNKKINPFLKELRALDVACLLLHHAGKDGKLRGASSMGDMANYIFRLADHPDKEIDNGEAWFTLTKDKQRAGGVTFKEFSMRFYQNPEQTETCWEVTDKGKKKSTGLNPREFKIFQGLSEGKKGKDIAGDLGCDKSLVSQTKTKARNLGLLTAQGTATPYGKTTLMEDNSNEDI